MLKKAKLIDMNTLIVPGSIDYDIVSGARNLDFVPWDTAVGCHRCLSRPLIKKSLFIKKD
jgi:hypothetical protein